MFNGCLIGALLFVFLGMVGAALSFAYFGWLGLLIYFVVSVLLVYFCFGTGLKIALRLAKAPLERQGRVLRDATVTVHRVVRSEPPAPGPTLEEILSDEDLLAERREIYDEQIGDLEAFEDIPAFEDWLEDEQDELNQQRSRQNWYELEITVQPSAKHSSLEWLPGFLIPVAFHHDSDDDSGEFVFDDCLEVEGIEVWDATTREYLPISNEGACQGGSRIRLKFGMEREVKVCRLRYLIDTVSDIIELPNEAQNGE